MKVYRVEIMIVDHDDLGPAEVKGVIESARYPNHCISPQVVSIAVREVDWSDAHPLNHSATWQAAFAKLFGGP